MKNVLRSVLGETLFKGDDLQNLFVVFKVSGSMGDIILMQVYNATDKFARFFLI